MAPVLIGSADVVKEAHELEVRRAGLHPLQACEQAARRSAPGAEIDAASRPDRRQRLLQADQLQFVVSSFLTGHVADLASYPTFPTFRSINGRVCALPVPQASPRVSEAAPSQRSLRFETSVEPEYGPGLR